MEQDVERFISLGYATDALKFARFDCAALSTINESSDMAWLSGVTSLVAHYSRPFERSSKMFRLDDEIVPQRFRDIHRRLIEARDKAHVHLDGDFHGEGSDAALHQIKMLKQRDGKHFWIPTRVLLVEPSDLPDVSALIDEILGELDRQTDQLERLLMPAINSLPAGLYNVSPYPPFFARDTRNDGIRELRQLGLIRSAHQDLE
jgi:hypothetical protein